LASFSVVGSAGDGAAAAAAAAEDDDSVASTGEAAAEVEEGTRVGAGVANLLVGTLEDRGGARG